MNSEIIQAIWVPIGYGVSFICAYFMTRSFCKRYIQDELDRRAPMMELNRVFKDCEVTNLEMVDGELRFKEENNV